MLADANVVKLKEVPEYSEDKLFDFSREHVKTM